MDQSTSTNMAAMGEVVPDYPLHLLGKQAEASDY
jgi:hypothetical protein